MGRLVLTPACLALLLFSYKQFLNDIHVEMSLLLNMAPLHPSIFDYSLDESLYQPRVSLEYFGPPLRSLSDVPSRDERGWDPRYLPPTTLDLIAPWPVLGIDAPLVEGSPELQSYIEDKEYNYEDVLLALNHEVQHIVRMVLNMRFASDGTTLHSTINDDRLVQRFQPGYDIIRKDDYDLWVLAEMGRLSDHFDTVDFFIERFAPHRFGRRMMNGRVKEVRISNN